MILRVFAVSAAALVVGSLVETARAGQIFVCNDGQMIEIAAKDIEHAKKTNACVAAHYGLSIADQDDRRDATTGSLSGETRVLLERGPLLERALQTDVPGLPERRPEGVDLRRSSKLPDQSQLNAPARVADAGPIDYRRVPIINARPGAKKWFHHTH